jgi:hypothetical protein
MTGATYTAYQRLWAQVGKMRRSRPDPASLSKLMISDRLSAADVGDLTEGYDADWTSFNKVNAANFAMPGFFDVLQLRRLGKISQADYDQAVRQLGWYNDAWVKAQEQVTPMPNLYTLMRDSFLGVIDDATYGRYVTALGHTDHATLARVESSFYQIPSGPELVQLAVRDAWNQDVVRRWGYDAEFPEELLYWMRAQGWDWGRTFTDRNGRVVPSVHWPQLFWRAHWAVISPGQAYQAYRRLRPDRIARYRADFPGLTPFTSGDLATVLRVHDYPPAARDWLAALQSQPLRMGTIRTAYNLGVRDRAWATEQLRDIGYLPDDAAVALDTIDAQQVARENAWIDRLVITTARDTAREIVAGYDDGFVPRDDAMQRLDALSIPTPTADRMLSLADSRRLRADLRAALAVLRREYLGGALSDGEVVLALRGYRVSDTAAARYLARWQGLRSLERRTASTGQILQWVRDGMMTAPAALLRLGNLGWAGGDALIQVNDALHKLEAHEATVAQHQAKQAQASAKQLQASIKAGQAAVKAAQAQLRRLTPLATIKKWLTATPDPIVSESWAVLRLEAMGYDRPDIDRYFAEWREESAAKAAGGKAKGGSPPTVPAAQPMTGAPPGG